jgi:hypothetical protein
LSGAFHGWIATAKSLSTFRIDSVNDATGFCNAAWNPGAPPAVFA